MRWSLALLAVLAFILGCGSENETKTEPVSWLDGKATVVPLHSAFIALHGDLSPKQKRVLRDITGAKRLGRDSYYLPPKQFISNCRVGILPTSACP